MKLGIAIFPPKEVQDVANRLRKRYDPNYALIAPHITIKEAFEVPEDTLPDVVNTLNRIADETNSFELHIHKVSHFHPTNNVIYFAIQENEQLNSLHERIFNDPLLKHERKYSFVPHVTIGQNIADDELHDIYSRLRMRDFDFKFAVNRFHLVYQLDNLQWSTYETFKFNS